MSDSDTHQRPVETVEQTPAAPATPAVQGRNVPAHAPEKTHEGEILTAKRSKRRFILPVILLAAIGYGAKAGYDWFVDGRFLVSTDDAYVKADVSIIAAKVSGYLASVPVSDNEHVAAGDTLVQIDPVDYRIAVDAARAKLETQRATIARLAEQEKAQQPMIEQAEAQVSAAEADLIRAQAAFVRAEKLASNDFGSKAALDQARADRDRATATLASAQAAVSAAKANLAVIGAQKLEATKVLGELRSAEDKAERDLAATTVRAPFGGVVGNRAAQPGQFVQPGTRLLALVPLDKAYVEANFKETQISGLKPGQKVNIIVDAYSGKSVEGTVESIAPASGSQFSLLPPENATGNFTKIVQRVPVRIAVEGEAARKQVLRPGLSVVVDVDTRDPSQPKPTLLGALGFDR